MRFLRSLTLVALAIIGFFLFAAGVGWYWGVGSVLASPYIPLMVVVGVACLMVAIVFSHHVVKIIIGLIVIFDGFEFFESYTCGGFGPFCLSWWYGQEVGLIVILVGVAVVAWGVVGRSRAKVTTRLNL
ncbi:MAG: hypothetical protein ABSB56_03610 [Nitrososphaerales archaeon]|jgi:hypothetical protein